LGSSRAQNKLRHSTSIVRAPRHEAVTRRGEFAVGLTLHRFVERELLRRLHMKVLALGSEPVDPSL
jgi:hypothetical protein